MSDALLPRLNSAATKYSRGMVVVVAGSTRYPGAAVLAVGGARRGGAGFVRFVCADAMVRDLVLRRFPDVVTSEGLDPDLLRSASSFVIGSGTAADDVATQTAVHHALRTDAAVLIDAGMLDWLATDQATQAQVRERMAPVVITPHSGEASRMGVYVAESARTVAAMELAHTYKVVSVLKGAGTVVATEKSVAYVDDVAGPELATAGTGDVLAGLLGGMLAAHQVHDTESAGRISALAVRAHAYSGGYAAARLATVTALDVMELLPYAMKELVDRERM